MFVAAGAGVYGAAMFHLFTHAFFKALLFLGSGSVITAMHHEQDMRHYGGLRTRIPFTFWTMMIGTFAITGVGIPLTAYGFAGFLSKDAIIESAFASGNGFAFWALVAAACFTSFYSWRLMFMTFYGEARWGHGHGEHGHGHGHDDHGHAHEPHESPLVMTIPLGVLALGSVFAGMIWYGSFFGDHDKVSAFFSLPHHEAAAGEAHSEETAAAGETAAEGAATEDATHAATTEGTAAEDHATGEAVATEGAATGEPQAEAGHAPQGAILMLNNVMAKAHESPVWVKVSPFVAMLIGLVTAYVFYIRDPSIPGRLAATQPILYRFLLNKWYFDEIYDALFTEPAKRLGRFLWRRGDGNVIDGTINGVAMGIVPFFTRLAGRAQSGYLFHYAFAMVIGIAVLLVWMTLSGGAH
jgi:NADH-quinone oxidoreductase subunit L